MELSKKWQKVINVSSTIGAILTVIFSIWAWQAGVLQSKETLSEFILRAGIYGPPLFILLQNHYRDFCKLFDFYIVNIKTAYSDFLILGNSI